MILEDASPFLPELDIDKLRQKKGAKWASVGHDQIPAWVADMDFQVAPEIQRVLADMVERGDLGYLDSQSGKYLSELFATRYHIRHGLDVDPGLVRITSDVVQAIGGCIFAFTDPGDKVLFLTPTYPPFFSVVSGLSRQIMDIDLVRENDTYVIDFDALQEAVADQRPTMLLLCNPHNPLGRVFTRTELETLAEIALVNDMTIVSDEIHCDLVFQGYKHIPIAAVSDEVAKKTVTLSSASKTFNIAGLHCAQMAFGSKELFDSFQRCPSVLLGGVSSLGIAAASTAYAEGALWLDAIMEILNSNRNTLINWTKQFPSMGFIPPEATYLAWINLRFLDLGCRLADLITEKTGIVLSDGLSFGKAGAGYVRLNFATGKTILEEILERLGNFISHG